eukprot:PhM_4_TR8806/c0_g1_i1/m.83657
MSPPRPTKGPQRFDHLQAALPHPVRPVGEVVPHTQVQSTHIRNGTVRTLQLLIPGCDLLVEGVNPSPQIHELFIRTVARCPPLVVKTVDLKPQSRDVVLERVDDTCLCTDDIGHMGFVQRLSFPQALFKLVEVGDLLARDSDYVWYKKLVDAQGRGFARSQRLQLCPQRGVLVFDFLLAEARAGQLCLDLVEFAFHPHHAVEVVLPLIREDTLCLFHSPGQLLAGLAVFTLLLRVAFDHALGGLKLLLHLLVLGLEVVLLLLELEHNGLLERCLFLVLDTRGGARHNGLLQFTDKSGDVVFVLDNDVLDVLRSVHVLKRIVCFVDVIGVWAQRADEERARVAPKRLAQQPRQGGLPVWDKGRWRATLGRDERVDDTAERRQRLVDLPSLPEPLAFHGALFHPLTARKVD